MQKKATKVGGIAEHITEQCEEWAWVLLRGDLQYSFMALCLRVERKP